MPPERPNPPKGLLIGLGVGVVVAAVAVAGIFFVPRRDTATPTARTVTAAPSRTATVPPRTQPPAATRPPTSPAPTSPGSKATPSPPPATALVPGWTAVEGREFAAFDVPPDWKVESPGLLTGFETADNQRVIMHNIATFKDNACPAARGSYRARAGFVSPKGQNAKNAAGDISKQWATIAGTHEDLTASPVSPTVITQIKIAGGTVNATMATTTLTVTEKSECPAPTMTFTAVSFAKDGAVVVFLLCADQGVPDALPADVATKIIGSLRPI